MTGSDHPWWAHIPASERSRLRRRLLRLRLRTWVAGSRQRILLTTVGYLLLCLLPLLHGQWHLSVLAVLQLLLVPPVGYLVYLLAWHEFHR